MKTFKDLEVHIINTPDCDNVVLKEDVLAMVVSHIKSLRRYTTHSSSKHTYTVCARHLISASFNKCFWCEATVEKLREMFNITDEELK